MTVVVVVVKNYEYDCEFFAKYEYIFFLVTLKTVCLKKEKNYTKTVVAAIGNGSICPFQASLLLCLLLLLFNRFIMFLATLQIH